MKGRPITSGDLDARDPERGVLAFASMKGRPITSGDLEYRALRDTAQFEPR